MLKLILATIGKFAREAWMLPQSIANVFSQSRELTDMEERETERLDRIRNPSKYLGN